MLRPQPELYANPTQQPARAEEVAFGAEEASRSLVGSVMGRTLDGTAGRDTPLPPLPGLETQTSCLENGAAPGLFLVGN